MIYLITGIPGSGKTLYAVSTLIKSLLSDKLVLEDGTEVERRLVVDGIPGLAIDHQLMCRTDVGEKSVSWAEDAKAFGNWWTWCQPGDVLVVDEVQRICRPRSMGSKPPQFVTELETHRHKGVDLVLITQSPMLLDQNVRRLVGRHQHIRRLFGMNRAVVYDWDGCQSDVSRVSGATKSYWSYPKEAFKLYTSSQLHTKQKQKIPAWVAVPILAVVGGVAVFPTAYSTLMGAASGKGVSQSSTTTTTTTTAGPPGVFTLPAAAPTVTASAPPPALPAEPAATFAGCATNGDKCWCYDEKAVRVDVAADICQSRLATSPGANVFTSDYLAAVPKAVNPDDIAQAARDGEVFASMQGPIKR